MNDKKKNSSVAQSITHALFDLFCSAKNYNYKRGKSDIIIKRTEQIEDRPPPERISKENEVMVKQILFGKYNIKNNERQILKLLLYNQNRANDVKKLNGFFIRPEEYYFFIMSLIENIAYYSFIFHLYINSSQKNKAKELFLLMNRNNKELIKTVSDFIIKTFKNLQDNNKIGKLIKYFFQILSVMIKLSYKCNKLLIEDYYVEIYIKTMKAVRDRIIENFKTNNNELESDYKLLGRFFYNDCMHKIAIYFLYRYQPFNIVIPLLQYINEQYNKKNILYLINSENLLLLKMYYNLALIYYVDGNNKEAIINLNKAKGRLSEIVAFPYTILKDKNIQLTRPRFSPKNKSSNDFLNNNGPDRTSINSFNIDETFEKYVAGNRIKKRSISSRMSGDLILTEKNFEPRKVFCSNIMFGNEKYIDKEPVRYINDCLSQKMEIEIELLLAEIELDQKNYKESFSHINKILKNEKQSTKKCTKEKSSPQKKMFNFDNNSTLSNRTYLKLNDYNKTSYSYNAVANTMNLPNIPISESNGRIISYILEVIEREYLKRNEYSISYNETNNVVLYDYKKSCKTDRTDYNKRYDQNNNREKKISLETEKFFLFICGLSIYQLQILNEFQPEPSNKRDDLPILFPNQFKDCLTFSQRLALNNLDTMNLSRYIVLKDSNKDITPENLDYVFLTKKIKSSHKDKNYDCVASRNSNDKYFFDIKKQLSKSRTTNSPDSSEESTGSKRGFAQSNPKSKFEKERYQKYVEEDKIFNQKITEITKNDDKNFLEINRNKILRILHGLQPKDKQLLMKSSGSLINFLKKVEKKMSKNKDKKENYL